MKNNFTNPNPAGVNGFSFRPAAYETNHHVTYDNVIALLSWNKENSQALQDPNLNIFLKIKPNSPNLKLWLYNVFQTPSVRKCFWKSQMGKTLDKASVPRHAGKYRRENGKLLKPRAFSFWVSSYTDDGNSPRTINVSVQMRSDCRWWVRPGTPGSKLWLYLTDLIGNGFGTRLPGGCTHPQVGAVGTWLVAWVPSSSRICYLSPHFS